VPIGLDPYPRSLPEGLVADLHRLGVHCDRAVLDELVEHFGQLAA
jgi:hypothetical protein